MPAHGGRMNVVEAKRFGNNLHDRQERVARLRDELNAQLDLVCFSREKLEEDVKTSIDHRSLVTSVDFLKKLSELTSAFDKLTNARIRLLKAEKAHEDDMSPADERRTVHEYVRSVTPREDRHNLLVYMLVAFEQDSKLDVGKYTDWNACVNNVLKARANVRQPSSD